MKTIKQIADEIGVSKQAVFKKIKKDPLSTGLLGLISVIDGKFMVSDDGETLIKKAFSQKEPSTNPQTEPLTKNLDETMVDVLLQQSEMLRKELEIKNEQITQLQKLLDQEQQLHAMTKQQLLQIQDKGSIQEAEYMKKDSGKSADEDKSYLRDPDNPSVPGTYQKDGLDSVIKDMRKKSWWNNLREAIFGKDGDVK